MADFLDDELAGPIEREVDRLTEDCAKRMLRGDAKDYAAYSSLVARHITLTAVKEFIVELRTPKTKQGDQLDTD